MKKKIILGILAFLVIAQFFRIDKENPSSLAKNDFLQVENVPTDIGLMIKSACYDCHSNESKYPWYTNIAPVSWWIKSHINEGREELNFSEWNTYSEKKKNHKLEECVEMIEEGEMPVAIYVAMHSEANYSDEELTKLVDWFKGKQK